jgi:hypothetical protein
MNSSSAACHETNESASSDVGGHDALGAAVARLGESLDVAKRLQLVDHPADDLLVASRAPSELGQARAVLVEVGDDGTVQAGEGSVAGLVEAGVELVLERRTATSPSGRRDRTRVGQKCSALQPSPLGGIVPLLYDHDLVLSHSVTFIEADTDGRHRSVRDAEERRQRDRPPSSRSTNHQDKET